jgi:hypothetical protein
VLAYAVSIADAFARVPTGTSSVPVAGLPTLADGVIALLGISHASYIAYKAAPHSKEQPPVPTP